MARPAPVLLGPHHSIRVVNRRCTRRAPKKLQSFILKSSHRAGSPFICPKSRCPILALFPSAWLGDHQPQPSASGLPAAVNGPVVGRRAACDSTNKWVIVIYKMDVHRWRFQMDGIGVSCVESCQGSFCGVGSGSGSGHPARGWWADAAFTSSPFTGAVCTGCGHYLSRWRACQVTAPPLHAAGPV